MQVVSRAYKEEMKKELRDHSYIRVTIGVVNQEAQEGACIADPDAYTYYSSLKKPLDNYQVETLYAACDENYSSVDGSMYFMPRSREDVVLNQGLVTEALYGSIEITFPVPYDIRGLTVEFGKAYPVDFAIESDSGRVEIQGNADGHFVTDEIFPGTTYLRITPTRLSNGQGRFRIHQITMGAGIYFDGSSIISATKKEHVNPVMEELPTLDFELVVSNKDRAFDIENEESTVNFLEIGQEITVLYGQELDDGRIEWVPGATAYLRQWSADDEEMSFTATDRFEDLSGTYYRGEYRKDGISLYDLAVDVLTDAGVDARTYWVDNYLKDVMVCNPVPATSHKEALQMIANAGRSILSQDRSGNIFIRSSFVPDMTASSDNEAYYSHAAAVLDRTEKDAYASAAKDFTRACGAPYFLPRQSGSAVYLDTGYVSDMVSDENGEFLQNPSLRIEMEARYKCFGLTIEFGANQPQEMSLLAYLNGELQEEFFLGNIEPVTVVTREFPEMDALVMEFSKTSPYSRVLVDKISFGAGTDYDLSYGSELTKTPKGTQLPKVRELQVIRTLYGETDIVKQVAKEKIEVTALDNRYTFYFSSPTYSLDCSVTDVSEGVTASIVEKSNYFATVEVTGIEGMCEVVVTGKEYAVTQAKASRQLNPTGSVETWINPLVSDMVHAADLADWVGDYLKADREYELSYRGEPRIDANDIAFLENKYVPDMLIRVYDHVLKFNGALSGTIKARRDVSYVAAAKN